jgi:hypothetical protein
MLLDIACWPRSPSLIVVASTVRPRRCHFQRKRDDATVLITTDYLAPATRWTAT